VRLGARFALYGLFVTGLQYVDCDVVPFTTTRPVRSTHIAERTMMGVLCSRAGFSLGSEGKRTRHTGSTFLSRPRSVETSSVGGLTVERGCAKRRSHIRAGPPLRVDASHSLGQVLHGWDRNGTLPMRVVLAERE